MSTRIEVTMQSEHEQRVRAFLQHVLEETGDRLIGRSVHDDLVMLVIELTWRDGKVGQLEQRCMEWFGVLSSLSRDGFIGTYERKHGEIWPLTLARVEQRQELPELIHGTHDEWFPSVDDERVVFFVTTHLLMYSHQAAWLIQRGINWQ